MRVWCVVRSCSLLLTVFLLFGCNRSNPDSSLSPNTSSSTPAAGQALTIQPSYSPTNGDSREPEFSATHDGRIILSWVEKVGEKRYALRTSARDRNGWSEARTVAQGENWFVNWADFPSVIALRDGSLAAHWLVKSGKGTASIIAKTDISRSSGFPRMALLGEEVHFAWTEFGKPSQVRTAFANIAAYK